jgi:hypothetical protein
MPESISRLAKHLMALVNMLIALVEVLILSNDSSIFTNSL